PLQGDGINKLAVFTSSKTNVIALFKNVPRARSIDCFPIDTQPRANVLQPINRLLWEFSIGHWRHAGHKVTSFSDHINKSSQEPFFRFVVIVGCVSPLRSQL